MDDDHRRSVAYALADPDFGQVHRRFLIDTICDAPAEECENIVNALAHDRELALRDLHNASAIAKEDWKLKTRLATVAMYLGDTSIAAEMLQAEQPESQSPVTEHRPSFDPLPLPEWNPIQYMTFVHLFPTWSGRVEKLAELSYGTHDASFRSGISLALGGVASPDQAAKMAWRKVLDSWYLDEADSGTHSAAGWALRMWGFPLKEIPEEDRQRKRFSWQLTKTGLTMIRIPAGEFDRWQDSRRQRVRITRDFLLSDREVSVSLFRQFMEDAEYTGLKPASWEPHDFSGRIRDDHPAQNVSWYSAIAFCNWLSWKESLVSYYTVATNVRGNDRERPEGLWIVQPNADANGYRLPTEAEWEYACRAGTTTTFTCGNDPEILVDFAAFLSDRTASCGSKRCNGWGLFDMHGNVWEWCWDHYGDYEDAAVVTDPSNPPQGAGRVARGGCWGDASDYCESAHRHRPFSPMSRTIHVGFRVVKGASR